MIQHTRNCPYPAELLKGQTVEQTIVDAKCVCGHLQSEHNDTIAYGHGDCSRLCHCRKFTWAGYVFQG